MEKIEILEKAIGERKPNGFVTVEKLERSVFVDGEKVHSETVSADMRKSTPVGIFLDWLRFGSQSEKSPDCGKVG